MTPHNPFEFESVVGAVAIARASTASAPRDASLAARMTGPGSWSAVVGEFGDVVILRAHERRGDR